MSKIICTQVGKFNLLSDGRWLWQCPTCGQWAHLSKDQWDGKVSVLHECGYHETNRFGVMLFSTIEAKKIMRREGEDVPIYAIRHEPFVREF